jgi:GntR family transcriptional regulator / MocR family aminotransferase
MHVSLVGRKDLTGEIYRQLRRAILDGRLPPGDGQPPTRELARRLSVSRTTVTVAYDRLAGEGFITSRVGDGTFVCDDVAGPPGPAGVGTGAYGDRPGTRACGWPSPATSAWPAACRPAPRRSW